MNRRLYKKEKKNSSKKRKILTISLIIVASMLISLSTYAVYLTKKAEIAADNAFQVAGDREKSNLREEKVEPLNDNVSVLFIGIDDSEERNQGDENSRSDALMLATLNNKSKTVKLVSIPRDSYVYIDEVGYNDKITHAHSYGGTRVAIETVENLLEVPVDYYVKMNFNAFVDVINALGGIEAEVPYQLLEKDENNKRTVQLEPGLQELDGREALALARTRKLDNDIERGKRQQMILSSIIKKASSASSFTKYGDVIDAVGDNMKTDLTFDEMKSFFEYIKGGSPQIDTLTLEGYDDMSTGVYYWKLDEESLEETQDLLKSHLGLQPETSNISDSDSDNSNYAVDDRP
ncbi:transcriptional attenuator, LytR family [Psychrobacillus sp. OK028]|uniref:LCP family protein n=1 Tax=Psychrobacillus sp. OK028 TaxID=1884359 RepID=UPI000890FE01|nr:LCP family protein [Psychrobacillus sp. OK028]SDM42623.1 transcriptional attenuator, LytR family [Psychrobacillus sp. OK028]